MSDAPTQWITAHDSYRDYKKGKVWLDKNKIPSMLDKDAGVTVYDRAKIAEIVESERVADKSGGPDPKEESDAEVTYQTAENVKATGKLLQTVLVHYERMHDKHERASKSLWDTMLTQLQHQNEHILNLENHALEMRAVTERAMSLEHERALMTKQAEHRGRLQENALDTLKQTLGPWAMQKFGMGAPGGGAGGNPAAEKVGAFTIQILGSISDEQFEKMREGVGNEVFAALSALRQSIRAGEIK